MTWIGTGDNGGDIVGEFGLLKGGGVGLCSPGRMLYDPPALWPDVEPEKSTTGVGSAWNVVNARDNSSSYRKRVSVVRICMYIATAPCP